MTNQRAILTKINRIKQSTIKKQHTLNKYETTCNLANVTFYTSLLGQHLLKGISNFLTMTKDSLRFTKTF